MCFLVLDMEDCCGNEIVVVVVACWCLEKIMNLELLILLNEDECVKVKFVNL